MIACMVFCWHGNAQTLQRRGYLGVLSKMLSSEQKKEFTIGVEIVQVFENSTAQAAGLLTGDIIQKINGFSITTSNDLGSALVGKKSGASIEVQFLRKGKNKTIKTVLQPMPSESFAKASVQHGEVRSEVGLLRSILTLPTRIEKPPVVFILQGFDCSSIEKPLTPKDPYVQLINALTEIGFATYRLEKSNVGDSEGLPCLEIGFDLETKGFADGLKQLAKKKMK